MSHEYVVDANYKASVRPKLEYATLDWNPFMQASHVTGQIEKV